jgi:hypothetical protein
MAFNILDNPVSSVTNREVHAELSAYFFDNSIGSLPTGIVKRTGSQILIDAHLPVDRLCILKIFLDLAGQLIEICDNPLLGLKDESFALLLELLHLHNCLLDKVKQLLVVAPFLSLHQELAEGLRVVVIVHFFLALLTNKVASEALSAQADAVQGIFMVAHARAQQLGGGVGFQVELHVTPTQ